jgi:hypothetical protein
MLFATGGSGGISLQAIKPNHPKLNDPEIVYTVFITPPLRLLHRDFPESAVRERLAMAILSLALAWTAIKGSQPSREVEAISEVRRLWLQFQEPAICRILSLGLRPSLHYCRICQVSIRANAPRHLPEKPMICPAEEF